MELVQLSARNEADTAELLELIDERMVKGVSVQERTASFLRHQLSNTADCPINGTSCVSNKERSYGVVVSGQALANCLLASNLPRFLKIVERLVCS